MRRPGFNINKLYNRSIYNKIYNILPICALFTLNIAQIVMLRKTDS